MLFQTNLEPDTVWNRYLASFPEGTDPIYRQRTEHNCSCCRSFIRHVGNVVTVGSHEKIQTIWNIDETPEPYATVAHAMNEYVKNAQITALYRYHDSNIGTHHNFDMLEGHSLRWDHFQVTLPNWAKMKKDEIGTFLSHTTATVGVVKRGFDEITDDAVNTVLELIQQNSLYRGREHKAVVQRFQEMRTGYMQAKNKEAFVWKLIANTPSMVGIRNTAIGTLLVDLSEGRDLEAAVSSYETKVAPMNYRRPTALITPTMINKARETVLSLGYEPSLHRRFATLGDINVNDVIWVNRLARRSMQSDPFEELTRKVPTKPISEATLNKIQEIDIHTFVSEVLPQAQSLDVMLDNAHTNRLMSLVAPVYKDAPSLFRWKNGFSWDYIGGAADSIKERVKAAGGNVTGDVRCSLSWFNYDDLDLHMFEPGFHIYYSQKKSRLTGGELDVDMNAGSGQTRSAVENITYPDRKKMVKGTHYLKVHQYERRETIDVGFEVEIEIDNKILLLQSEKSPPADRMIDVATLEWDGKVLNIRPLLPVSTRSRDIWGLTAQVFVPISTVLYSPNHWWGEKPTGNRHYFFILKDCLRPDPARGFYNEFLNPDLTEHRKVFEMLGAQMLTPVSDQQLSGLGFNDTTPVEVVFRVSGTFNSIIKVRF